MIEARTARRIGLVFICVFPFAPLTQIAYRNGGLKWLLVVTAIYAIVEAAALWVVGRSAYRSGDGSRRSFCIGAALLVMVLVLLKPAVSMGPPSATNPPPAEYVRQASLLIIGLVALGGFTLVAARLWDEGDRVLSLLGFVSLLVSTIIFTFTTSAEPLWQAMYQAKAATGNAPDWWEPFSGWFQSLGFAQRMLLYVAFAAYTRALWAVGWIGKIGGTILLGISLFWLATMFAILLFPDAHILYVLIGAPPASPYLFAFVTGVVLFRRISDAKFAAPVHVGNGAVRAGV